MLADLAIGFLMNIVAMLVHLAATLLILIIVRALEKPLEKSPYGLMVTVLLSINIVLMVAHIIEVGVWACLFFQLELTSSFSNAFYSAFVINTTLGLGDVAPAIRTRLLMPFSAASGILMIGWSTALLIYALQTFLPHLSRRR